MESALERHAGGRNLPAVQERARELAAASVSANTRRAYEGALRRLRDWLAGRLLDDATLAEYLATRFEEGHSPSVGGQVVAAVRFYAKIGSQASPVGPATERVLAGFRREGRARGRGQVVGVRWEQADAAAAVAGSSGGSVRGLRDAALLAVMSDGLLRVSEAAALEAADLEAEGANTLTIRRSKTDQEGEGAVQYIGGPTVARVRAWLSAAGIVAGPMFQRLDKAGRPRGRLSTVSIRAIVHRRAAEAGIEGRVSGHSLRVGGAQSLAAAGASIVEMQTAGRWQSPSMPGRYARGQPTPPYIGPDARPGTRLKKKRPLRGVGPAMLSLAG